MAHSKARLKKIRQDKVRNLRNKSSKSEQKTLEKKFRTAVEAGDKDAAAAAMKDVVSKLDKMAKVNTIHSGTASRKKSRLATLFNKSFA